MTFPADVKRADLRDALVGLGLPFDDAAEFVIEPRLIRVTQWRVIDGRTAQVISEVWIND